MSFISAGNTTTTTLLINGDTTGNLVFNTGGANTTALTISNTQNATFANNVTITGTTAHTGNASFSNVTTTGSVGVGTASPSGKLSVSTGTSATVMNIINSSGTAELQQNGNDFYITNYNASGSEIFRTNGTERMRLESGGSLCLGATGTQLGEKFSVVSTGTWNTFLFIPNGNNGLGITNTSGTVAYGAYTFYNNGTSFSYCGNISVSAGAVAYTSASDYRLKENITTISNALDAVSKLKPINYTWKADGTKGQGFIAHELQEICPQAVTGTKDDVDADGKPKYQGVDTSFLVAMLTKAIQELNAKVEAQAAEIAALKAGA